MARRRYGVLEDRGSDDIVLTSTAVVDHSGEDSIQHKTPKQFCTIGNSASV